MSRFGTAGPFAMASVSSAMKRLLRHPLAKAWLAVLMLLAAQAGGAADTVRPFASGSLEGILGARTGKPFVLVLWSLDCQYCPTELKMLGDLKRSKPALDIVLIATDPVSEASRLVSRIKGYDMGKVEQWAFADDIPERLRFEIDSRWYGEVPRTYFYNRQHQREARTGLVSRQFVEDWLVRTAVSSRSTQSR
ncbi:hypothetical protein SAMN05216414_11246 [Nitrosovibrio sp. Nv17]|jgi:hypothetical protein|nr:hypothetical protein SAMN05216414_11246 [Nitrosovibrio sp. Nv17]